MPEMTEKLYYADAYISEFSACVLSASPCDGGYDVVLDRTAFFPEEGGQSADRGYIGASRVSHAYEESGVVHHITDTAPELGMVECRIDFDERFEKMQLHTAEHILCGIIHRLYGLDNVGFHLGDDVVTFDISSPLTREELHHVETLACEAVFANHPVTTSFPSESELRATEYRSKLDTYENIRLVTIGDVDVCACCAPHVAYTGEIGNIKILHAERHRGGMRIWITAGRRAVTDYRMRYNALAEMSAMLSSPAEGAAEMLKKYMADTEQLKYLLKESRRAYFELFASSVAPTDGNAVYVLPDASAEDLRTFVNSATDKVGGILVALTGTDGDYKHVISSSSVNLSALIKEANSALCGRGGGKPNMVQGSFGASLDEIRAYFNA